MTALEEVPVAAPQRAVAGRPARRGLRRREWLWGFAFIAPNGLGLLAFYIWPVFQTLYYSFTEWGAFGGHTWIGAENYAKLVSDPEVLKALKNTLLYAGLVLLGVPVSLVLAALINTPGLRGAAVYRVLYFLPVVTMPAAVGMVWRWLYNGDIGLINYVLSLVGIEGHHWVADPRFALYATAVVGIWMTVGYNMVIFAAGLKGIPKDLYEAAELDGAGPIRQFFSITLPMLSPTAFFVTVLTSIGALQVFDVIYLMLGSNSAALRNPAIDENQTIVFLFFERAFVDNDKGYAAAIAFVLLLVILLLTIVQFRAQKKWVHYA
ncbi:carbohydrate ABC transporter permease [Saccharothrix variisporea]|uniref:Carbohydrate ABC transporter membrane protein 1 (CUT1 family) n=1 Tax=Saccharothrix variisporea TaxID=543527 RepID=A0A495X0V0_9PSEU|nr:sugar ABC transporter permease [Saccharothrix variisporea]RKT67540.1 carbohydrate ABC transporter membrane protein 1 (CUT1 family) [Saccharothrix variisporea]